MRYSSERRWSHSNDTLFSSALATDECREKGGGREAGGRGSKISGHSREEESLRQQDIDSKERCHRKLNSGAGSPGFAS